MIRDDDASAGLVEIIIVTYQIFMPDTLHRRFCIGYF